MSGDDVKYIREKSGLTQTEFAKRLGVSLRTVQNYEVRDSLPEDTARHIEYEFGIKNANVIQMPGSPARTQSEYIALEKRIDELQKRFLRLEAYVDELSLTLLGREKPEKHAAGDSGHDRELPLGGYAI